MALISGIVDISNEHMKLVYGDAKKVEPQDFVPVALVAPGPGNDFTVQFTLVADGVERTRMIGGVQKELEFYLIEKGEPDPWLYAQYHCGTASDFYSMVHWIYYPKGNCVASHGEQIG